MEIENVKLKSSMKEKGFKFLESGMNSLVFQKPGSNEVVKLFKLHDSYTLFLKIISQNKNIHFPEIKAHVKLSTYKGWHILKIEPLFEIPYDEYAKDLFWLIKAAGFYKRGTWAKGLSKSDISSIKAKIKQNPTLASACKILGENNKTYLFDIGYSNVMRRSDGTVVITDPFV